MNIDWKNLLDHLFEKFDCPPLLCCFCITICGFFLLFTILLSCECPIIKNGNWLVE